MFTETQFQSKLTNSHIIKGGKSILVMKFMVELSLIRSSSNLDL